MSRFIENAEEPRNPQLIGPMSRATALAQLFTRVTIHQGSNLSQFSLLRKES
jgi:hypothetical protein